MAEEEFKEEENPFLENESEGLETACYRKCRGQFCLTPVENRYEHEIALDFSPFLSDLANFSSKTYERIETLLQLDHCIDRVRKLIHNKHVTCFDLCLFYLKRVQMTNHYHKTIIELNPHLLSQAKQLDGELDEKKPMNKLLFGCVAGIKGNISVCDMYNDAGAYVLHEQKMTSDASVVKKLREQGCLILGRTNLSEWAYAFTQNVPSGFSAVGGQCVHPDDYHEDVSGSSSGSAAGIKLNLFTFSIGTETHGSIISPAVNVRNVCSLKPTLGSWPGEDVIPVNYDQDTCGPMARTVRDVELLHRIATGRTSAENDNSRGIRVGYLGQSAEGPILLQLLASLLPLTTLIDLNADDSLAEPMESILNPSAKCNTSFLDIICFTLARDVPSYLASHSAFYSHRTLSSIIEWNSAHPEYIPYGQTLFLRAQNSPISSEVYNQYKQTVNDSYDKLVQYLRSTYALDCLLTIGNEDLLASTTMCGIPRANLTLDYYDPAHRQLNVIAVGLAREDDFLLLRLLQRLEKANLQAGKIDIRTPFQKYFQSPIRSAYKKSCSIL